MTRTALRIQAVLYNEDRAAIERSIASIAASVGNWRQACPDAPHVTIAYGDASPDPLFSERDLAELSQVAGEVEICYRSFGENTGYGKGHCLLVEDASEDFVLIINPDIVFAPPCIGRLVATMESDASIGIVEARQAPFENAKVFDFETGETDWACGACLLVRRAAFERVEGFDWRTFFMYCEDVDLSWAVRHAGYRVVYQPAAMAFHPHRLSSRGAWEPSVTEQYYDALGKLLLARKWGDRELVRRMLAEFAWDDNPLRRKAAADYRKRVREGNVPNPVEGGTAAATFHGIDHTTYRQLPAKPRASAEELQCGDGATTVLPAQQAEAPCAQEQPFLTAVIATGGGRLEKLAETLTCLAAQSLPDFEVLLALTGDSAHQQDALDLISALPANLKGRVRVFSAGASRSDALEQACAQAAGLYVTILREGDLVTDCWVEAFREGAAAAPGNVIRAFAVKQFWKHGDAPLIDATALYCADAMEAAYCTSLDCKQADNAHIPSGSWCFPLFAVNDLGLVRASGLLGEGALSALGSACGFAQVGQATLLERCWTESPLQPFEETPIATSAIRRAVPVEVKAAVRFAQRRLGGRG